MPAPRRTYSATPTSDAAPPSSSRRAAAPADGARRVIVVDALDECESNGKNALLELIATRFGKASDEMEETRVLACLAMQPKFYSLLVCEKGEREKGEPNAPKPDLPAALLSRFDLLWLILDIC